MGEKGNVADVVSAGSASVIERTTERVTESVVDLGQDTADIARSKVIGAAVDQSAEAAREKLTRKEPDEPIAPDVTPPA